MVVHGLRGYSSSLVYCLECFDTVIWQQEGHPAGKNTECSYAGGGDITGARCKWFAYVSSCNCHCQHLHHILLKLNPEWFDILVPVYPGCYWNWPLTYECVCVLQCIYIYMCVLILLPNTLAKKWQFFITVVNWLVFFYITRELFCQA